MKIEFQLRVLGILFSDQIFTLYQFSDFFNLTFPKFQNFGKVKVKRDIVATVIEYVPSDFFISLSTNLISLVYF